MEEVEEANKAAIESCHRVIGLLSQPKDQVQHRNLAVETEEAVVKFKKVVSLLSNNGLGHSRVRKHNTLKIPFSQSVLLDNPYVRRTNHQSKNLQLPQTSFPNNSIRVFGSSIKNPLYLGMQSSELRSNGKSPIRLNQQLSSTHLKRQQMLQPSLLLQQRLKHKTEMALALQRKGRSVGNLNFDSSSIIPSMWPFMSPFCIDERVANLEGSDFHLVGVSQKHKETCPAKGDEGSSGCHCLNKRKPSVQRSFKMPAVIGRATDIPPDDYSWRKYGQKTLKGTPHPRRYYKCSTKEGCPARKHVQRCFRESYMLIVTYKEEHNHPTPMRHSTR